MVMSHLPRNGRYELFTYGGKTHCFDDLEVNSVRTTPEMLEWLRSQPPELCHKMDETDVAYYLQPQLYLMWKLKYAS